MIDVGVFAMWSHSVFRDAGVPLMILDPAGRIVSGNPAAQALVGRRSLSGTRAADLFAESDQGAIEAFLREVSILPAGRSRTIGPLEVDWSAIRQRITVTGSLAQGESFQAVLVALQEVPTETAVGPTPSPTDPLTGIATHSGGYEALEAAVSPDADGCLLVVDLDSFAELNASLGNADGDRVLVEVARRLVQVVPPTATVARYDGDTFLVVSPDTPLSQAEPLATRVLAALAIPMEVSGTRVVTASIGVSSVAARTANQALSRGMRSLQDAKDRGGRQVVLEGTSTRMYVRRRSDLLAAMRELESDIKGMAEEVEKAKREAASAKREARTDERTGLPNKRQLEEVLDSLPARLGDPEAPVAVLFVDLDEFGQINKAVGHDRGDRAMIAVAQMLARTCREEDLLFREAGDQFVVLLPEADLAGGLLVAERLRAAVEAARIPHGGRPDLPYVTLSIGAAAGRADQVRATKEAADDQCREAKLAGRNKVSPSAAPTPHRSSR